MGRTKVVPVLACCAAMFTAMMPISGATPEGTGEDPAPADPAPADLETAVRRDLHIELSEYMNRAATAQRLAEFEKLARAAYPMVFAGVRMDGPRALVSLSDGTGFDVAAKAVRQAGFEVVRVASSAATLQQQREAVRKWIATQPRETANVFIGDAVDVGRNTVVVYTSGTTAQVPSGLGAVELVVVDEPQPGPGLDDPEIPVTIAAPGEPYKGGQPFRIAFDATRYGKCSLGFNATDAAGHDVAITAGHCDPNNLVDPSAKTAEPHKIYDYADDSLGDELGHFGTSEFGPHDYSILQINDDQVARFRNNLVVGGPAGPSPATPPGGGSVGSAALVSQAAADTIAIDGVASPVSGMPACKSGAITGYTCGTVDMVGQTFNEGGLPGTTRKVKVEGFFSVSTCSVQGDSGGSVLSGTKALGLVSGGTSQNHQCADTDILTAQPIDAVLAANPGLALRKN
ncbi:S1 family peptidase [Nocardia concava]|uniref:S1 family peptidase n=1 Tax=Nocardia concava TaxID=257281 RepID=UPI000305B6B0|nr:S1 family peptidase [Nocardia concava]